MLKINHRNLPPTVHVIGGGLAGSECAFQLLSFGLKVILHEMRPKTLTPAHTTGDLAELVCSNSLKSLDPMSASGLLKSELAQLNSLVLKAAMESRVPAGGALAVDRKAFSAAISGYLSAFSNFSRMDEEVSEIPDNDTLSAHNEYWVIATGPLTSNALFQHIVSRVGSDNRLYFFDAIAPTLATESIDFKHAYKANRYDKGDDDAYLNIPLNKELYYQFISEIKQAEKIPLHQFEDVKYFESCLPIEVMVERGDETLRFGPMKPVGLIDPTTNAIPYAVIQLRQENMAGSMYSMVGFQTKMKWPEQKRVFSLLPALKNVEFYRYGSIHRNTYFHGPQVFNPDLSLKVAPHVFAAGQITGVEGYLESASMGLLAARSLAHKACILKTDKVLPPPNTMSGALLHYVTQHGGKDFQPMNTNFGVLGNHITLGRHRKHERKELMCAVARNAFTSFLDTSSGAPGNFAPPSPEGQHQNDQKA